MDNDQLKNKITTLLPEATFEVHKEFLHVIIPGGSLFPLIQILKEDPDLYCNYLSCLTCTDMKDFFYMVYIVKSFRYKHELVVKAKIIDRNDPCIETVSKLWEGADLLEREVYDFFGVKFLNHPKMKRLFLPDDWKGFPLRKDYVDEINVVEI